MQHPVRRETFRSTLYIPQNTRRTDFRLGGISEPISFNYQMAWLVTFS